MELDNERLLKEVVSQDVMYIVQKESVVDTSDLQTELERTKERIENCIIKKETEYAKLWNDWYKKCNECKYDKISYDKAYKDMQQKIERLQAQLGDLKVTSNSVSTPQVSKGVNNAKVIAPGMFRISPDKISREAKHVPNTGPISSKSSRSKNKAAEVEEHHRNLLLYKNNEHMSSACNNFKLDSHDVISKVVCASRGRKHKANVSKNETQQKNMPEIKKPKKNAKLRTQLFKKVSYQNDNTPDTSKNTKFAKQPIVEILPKIGEINALSKPVTSNSVSTPPVSKGVNNAKVISPGMFRISPDKVFREAKKVPNTD
nr:hypothetical protein [Tanacetum cinerariifolium]